MRVAVDTNVLVRAILQDDAAQARIATKTLTKASSVAIALPCLCELVWVLSRAAKISKQDIADAIEDLINADNVLMNRPAAEIGVKMLRAGGDFADAALAYEGLSLGADVFISFDKQAVELLREQSIAAKLLD